jgi:DNA-binding transcriptional LysR family regulator
MNDDGRLVSLDWNDVRFFLAVARGGTLAKAARALGVDQTTVGRRIASLEEKLSAALFARSAGGFELTAAGRRALDSAVRMEEAALELPAQAVDDAAPCAGTVRIATTEGLAERFVIPAIREVQDHHPRLDVVLLTGWAQVDLRRGEADLAVRLPRPTDPRLALRKLADFSLRLYASREYIARRGAPASIEGHPLIGYEDAVRHGGHAFTSLALDGGRAALQVNSGRVLVAAALAGIGIAQLSCYVGDEIPELVPVLPAHDKAYSVWLVTPQAKRRVAAVRVVGDAIARSFEARSGGADACKPAAPAAPVRLDRRVARRQRSS